MIKLAELLANKYDNKALIKKIIALVDAIDIQYGEGQTTSHILSQSGYNLDIVPPINWRQWLNQQDLLKAKDMKAGVRGSQNIDEIKLIKHVTPTMISDLVKEKGIGRYDILNIDGIPPDIFSFGSGGNCFWNFRDKTPKELDDIYRKIQQYKQ